MLWFNGELVEAAQTDALGAGNLLGWGVFTTLGVRGGLPLFLERHLRRLRRDAAHADVPLDWNDAQIADGLRAVLSAATVENGHARLTLTRRGDGRWNSASGADLSIVAQNATFSDEPIRVAVSEGRVHSRAPLAGAKTTSYLPYLHAWNAAREAGFHEALLLNENDAICEGARSSIFWLRNGVLFTPSLASGCLEGVGRELVLEWARYHGVPTREVLNPLDELLNASAVWTVSAASGPRRVRALHAAPERDAVLLWNDAAPCADHADFMPLTLSAPSRG